MLRFILRGGIFVEISGFTIEQLYAPNYNGPEGMWCSGINAAGFDLGAYGGRDDTYYRIPDRTALQYFADRGVNCFRLPITWERLQTGLGEERLLPVWGYVETVDFVTQDLKSYAIIDPHNNDAGLQYNYGTFDSVEMRDATKEDFIKLWVAIASRFKTNPMVIFELYNEPKWGRENGRGHFFDFEDNDESGELIEAWRQWMQDTIDAIRALGANNTILVPGLKHTNCRDWDGANYWGESLDGYWAAGNTRLAALRDPAMRIVYDVHQYFDTTETKSFTGDQWGCDAHDATFHGHMGADEGCLTNMVAWAKKYNKKVMVTEIASMINPWLKDHNPSSWNMCKAKMHSFLQRMNDSGVFLGYQVWQVGCPDCKGDLYAWRPYSIDWYRFSQWIDWPPEIPELDLSMLNQSSYIGQEGMWCTGMNAVGQSSFRNWRAPVKKAIRYFHDRGANCFRLPIRWELLQTVLGDIKLSLVHGYEETVDFITETLGDFVIIDPHNNDNGLQFQYEGPSESPMMVDATRPEFVRLWQAIAQKWMNRSRVIFGLYNEPKNGFERGTANYFNNDDTDDSGHLVETWRQWMQSTIYAIRASGANNTILVPGLKFSNCRDWDGMWYWGESFDDRKHSGNTRLAALIDPAMRLVYDVHQYFDTTATSSFTGDQYGCEGHNSTVEGYLGADEGCLTNLVAWAKQYNKKFMLTEIASMQDPDNLNDQAMCETKMHRFLQRMNESEVFLGYQVWQFGCRACKGDLYALRPYTIDWYRFSHWMNASTKIPELKPSMLNQSNYMGQEGMWCTGINAVGFDLGSAGGRSFPQHWRVPAETSIRYFHDRGANCFRLPITWERLQASLGDIELSLVSGYEETVDFITETLGDFVIIDPHNNDHGLQFRVGGTFESPVMVDATRHEFVRLWQAIARKWMNRPRVIFGLYNEPKNGFEQGASKYFDISDTDHSGRLVESWRQWMQSTINAIRALGAENTILVPGLRFSSCRDWDGVHYWGESLDDYSHSGNTRLAALKDPAMRLVYDVHQYFDTSENASFTGDQYGCEGHASTFEGYLGADRGCLENLVIWAKKYNKKFMITEIASMQDPEDNSSWDTCQTQMHSFLQRVNRSGVFLGYQVWQFGCPSCKGDLYADRPSNLDWYNLELYEPLPTSTTTSTSTPVRSPPSTSTSMRLVWIPMTTLTPAQANVDRALCTRGSVLASVVGLGHVVYATMRNAARY